ncbi:uncharacterized protein LOC120275906 isoform X2 [Dioscorea cayenensis subsp. rotundata]|uniref:Uncharacterized protein LOC120275906 isoform X2 n=1 Tax=Dioscorea cayennensis subsp. rotundata TaxID=55577 RepID=A0AB40CF53_DIOCR|nr:uncharacterized protein LOC120275906 isoform X2 [Dioscorea cayenensis subsp. rotundata]
MQNVAEGPKVESGSGEALSVLSIVIAQPEEVLDVKGTVSKSASPEKVVAAVALAKKGFLTRSDSEHEQCRVCQQQTEEPLLDLGCGCRGELAKTHKSCIEIWFRTRGSNKCEICQQVAVNIPAPEPQSRSNYWVWRIDPAHGGSTFGRGERERGCFSPLWVAFAILIGGLLLDVLISVSLGVSALPVNIIIGVLIVLGLGTALRLALECCHEWGSRRNIQHPEMNINLGYPPAV